MTTPADSGDLERIVTEVAREVLGARRRPRPVPAHDRIAIGSDHSGYRLKVQLARYLREDLGYEIEDCGAHGEAPVDYPDIARAVAERIRSGVCARGVLIDAAGIGSAMAANKIRGIRCALCHDEATARNGRLHNDANVLALGARVVNAGYARTIVRTFLRTAFEGGRHARRVEKIMRLEEEK